MSYKLFRGNYDNERFQSESILDDKVLTQKRKDQDKVLIKTIRAAIMNDEGEKIFTYIDLLNFTASINMCVKLCNAL